MKSGDIHRVRQFLKDYPGMSFGPVRDSVLVLRGTFSFSANSNGGKEITDAYELEIAVPTSFPHVIPTVKETERRIPRDGKHHVNSNDTLCLGSPLRLLEKISKEPTLVGFSQNCLVPHLYAVSNKLRYGGDFAFGELAHGEQGVVDDYRELFRLKTRTQVFQTLKLLGLKRRVANKKPCPCECGRRLGKCLFHRKLNCYRKLAPRYWFRTHAMTIGTGM